jgi:Protein of unknown function (DUF2637)
MNDLGTRQPGERSGGFRLLAFAAVSTGLMLLAAAAFVLSYAGVHAVALSAGISPRLARLYPLIFDAMLVIACAAILSLRGAGLPSRCYAWLSLLVLLVAVASADALHATGKALPRQPAAAAAAIIPWALVLIGFGLLVAMLRYSRLRRMAQTPQEPPVRRGGLAVLGFPPEPPALPAGFDIEPRTEAVPAAIAEYASELEQYLEGQPVPAAAPRPEPMATPAEIDPGDEAEAVPPSVVTAGLEPAAEPETAGEPEGSTEPGTPQFDRVHSSPVPPES